MPVYEMKSDLYCVSLKGGTVYLTDNKMEAAKQYAELKGRGKDIRISVFRQHPLSHHLIERICFHNLSESELLDLMTSLVLGKDIEPFRPPTISKREPKLLKDMDYTAVCEAASDNGEITFCGSHNRKKVYREVNNAIVNFMSGEKKQPVKRLKVAREVFGVKGNIPKAVTNVLDGHLGFMVEKGVIEREGRGLYRFIEQKRAAAVRKTKQQLEEERKAHEAVMT